MKNLCHYDACYQFFLHFHISETLLLKNYLNALINDNFIHIINLALFKIKYLV